MQFCLPRPCEYFLLSPEVQFWGRNNLEKVPKLLNLSQKSIPGIAWRRKTRTHGNFADFLMPLMQWNRLNCVTKCWPLSECLPGVKNRQCIISHWWVWKWRILKRLVYVHTPHDCAAVWSVRVGHWLMLTQDLPLDWLNFHQHFADDLSPGKGFETLKLYFLYCLTDTDITGQKRVAIVI